jgi:hypothetical protein
MNDIASIRKMRDLLVPEVAAFGFTGAGAWAVWFSATAEDDLERFGGKGKS